MAVSRGPVMALLAVVVLSGGLSLAVATADETDQVAPPRVVESSIASDLPTPSQAPSTIAPAPPPADGAPTAELLAPKADGIVGIRLAFDASGSSDADGVVVRWDWDFGDGEVIVNGPATVQHTFARAAVYAVTVTVYDADGSSGSTMAQVRVVEGCAGLAPTIVAERGVPVQGTAQRDVIVGTEGDDVISGGDGDDVICGLGGRDDIQGGDGDDVILGGPGDDVLRGHLGDDDLQGDLGDDDLTGGPDTDRCVSGATVRQCESG